MNALVVYVGTQAIHSIQNKGMSPSTSTIAQSSHMDIFQSLSVDLDTEGEYIRQCCWDRWTGVEVNSLLLSPEVVKVWTNYVTTLIMSYNRTLMGGPAANRNWISKSIASFNTVAHAIAINYIYLPLTSLMDSHILLKLMSILKLHVHQWVHGLSGIIAKILMVTKYLIG